MNKIWFTSDWHFSHKNILRYSKNTRGGCKDIEEMDEWLIAKWNATVDNSDTVYHIGDFTFCGKRKLREELIPRLNGNIIFIRGNHDRSKTMKVLVEEGYQVYDLYTLRLGNQHVELCHYPIEEWKNKRHGAWHLHGHLHNPNSQHRKIRNIKNRINVNFDLEGKMYSLKEVEEMIAVSGKNYLGRLLYKLFKKN